MSTHICSNCGHEEHIFGHGGARAEAEEQGLPFLGEIPLHRAIRMAADDGTPVAIAEPNAAHTEAYHAIAAHLVGIGQA